MKCNRCGSDMISKTGGNYYCPKCNFTVNDLVYRFQSCDMPFPQSFGVRYGWICPRCGKVNSPDVNSCGCNSTNNNIRCNGTESIPADINVSPTGTITLDVKDTSDNIWHWTFDSEKKRFVAPSC
jgi:hypothetical protein